MVTQVTSLSRNGISDWYIQRLSSYVMAAYVVFLVGFVLASEALTFEVWSTLFDQTWMQLATLVTLLATCAHAWIGMWTVGTDYLRSRTMGAGGDRLRGLYQVACGLLLVANVHWGIKILWGN